MKVAPVEHQPAPSLQQLCNNIAAKSKCILTKFRRSSATLSNNFLLLFFIFAIGIGITVIYNVRESKDCFPPEVQKYLQGDEECEEGAQGGGGAHWQEVVVHNLAAHGPVTPRTPVLVVLVRGGGRLRALLAALDQLPGVDALLLVLSHSRPRPALAASLHFCMLVEVYYPHAERGAGGGERTLHWWWTAHYVYEVLLPELLAGRAHAHLVLFLDDGCVVLPDLAHMVSLAHLTWASYFPAAAAVSLGGPPAPSPGGATFTLQAWSAPLGEGLGLHRNTWRRVVALRRHYCEFTAPHWSGALSRVFAHFPGGRALVLVAREVRVLHGSPSQLCALVRQTRLYTRRVRALLVRDRAGALLLPEPEAPPELRWSTPHDLALCINISNSFITGRRKRPEIYFPANNTDADGAHY